MPNEKPGDHPLTDITIHKIRTFSSRADSLVQKLNAIVSQGLLWSFLYGLYRGDKSIRVAGSEKRISIRDFEAILASLLGSAERVAKIFKKAKQKIQNE
jgi:hypothetical protein